MKRLCVLVILLAMVPLMSGCIRTAVNLGTGAFIGLVAGLTKESTEGPPYRYSNENVAVASEDELYAASQEDLAHWQARAEQGDGEALFQLAQQHFTKDEDEVGLQYLCRAASSRYDLAQYYMGTFTENGQVGLKQDYVRAHMWYTLAVTGGNADAKWYLKSLAPQMTPTQIEQADRLATDWAPEPSSCAPERS